MLNKILGWFKKKKKTKIDDRAVVSSAWMLGVVSRIKRHYVCPYPQGCHQRVAWAKGYYWIDE